MFTSFSDSALNALLATPACDRIPTPTKETLLISSFNSISPPPNSLDKFERIFFVSLDFSRFTVKVKSVVLSSDTF